MVNREWDKVRAEKSSAYLRAAQAAAAKLAGIEDRYEALFGDMGPGGIDYTKPLAGIPYADAIPDEVAQLLEVKRQYESERESYLRIVAEASAVVMRIADPDQAEAVTRRYLMRETWTEVAAAMGVHKSTAQRRAERGLVAMYEHLPHTWQLPHHSAL